MFILLFFRLFFIKVTVSALTESLCRRLFTGGSKGGGSPVNGHAQPLPVTCSGQYSSKHVGHKPDAARYRFPTPPRKSWKVPDFLLKIPGPGKSWKITLVLESSGKYPWKSCIF